MTLGVVVFPGSNCDRDVKWAAEGCLGIATRFLWHEERDLSGLDAVVIPGGFSYGDYLRCGAIARFSPVMQAVRQFASNGGMVLGICNGTGSNFSTTSIALVANTGQTLNTAFSTTTLTAKQCSQFQFARSVATWFQIH